jgi:translocation and assembly module TamB
VLHHWHQLHVREAHVDYVIAERGRELAIAQRTVVVLKLAAPRTEMDFLSGAAVALGLRQVTRITDQIGQSIGVDELTLAGDGGDTTALVAGKQVNSRLYARYAYGVFSQLGTLLLRYRLNRNLTLEAGTGENQSLDILYTVEK